jgi:putative membrane protein
MKQIIQIKKTFFSAIIAASALFIVQSCDNDKKPEDSKDVAEEHNEAKFINKNTEKDAQFIVNAAEINLEEIKLGELAQEKSTMPKIRALGKMMEEAHRKCLDDLTALANKKSITIPTSPTDNVMDTYKKLNNKSEADFNSSYCDMMVKGHKDAIVMFDKASTESTDTDIRDWALATLPELRKHLDHSITCQKTCEK